MVILSDYLIAGLGASLVLVAADILGPIFASFSLLKYPSGSLIICTVLSSSVGLFRWLTSVFLGYVPLQPLFFYVLYFNDGDDCKIRRVDRVQDTQETT